MSKIQPLRSFSFKALSSPLDVPVPDEDAVPDGTAATGEGPASVESPARRAHRLRMKAFLSAARSVN